MNWAAELIELYDKHKEDAGKITGAKPVLLPLYHSTVQAHLTVTIDAEGNFVAAGLAGDGSQTTIIPVTEDSDSRTSGPEAHPLCDKLEYIAGDMENFYPEKELNVKKRKDLQTKFDAYLKNLTEWSESPYSHPKVEAILKYVSERLLIKDLVSKGILTLGADGRLDEEKKIFKTFQTDLFVRFEVYKADPGSDPDYRSACWLDDGLREAYISYVNFSKAKAKERTEISYLSGKEQYPCRKHPRYVCRDGDGAKLFSANDSAGFTFRGRFDTGDEAFSIGYEDSLKLHNALKWIIRNNYAYRADTFVFVVWETDFKKLPDFMTDGKESITEILYKAVESGTGETYGRDVKAAFDGYKKDLTNASRVVMLSLDEATPGRLSLTGSQEFKASDYIGNIEFWYDSCEWRQKRVCGKGFHNGVPAIEEIVRILYGREGLKREIMDLDRSDSLFKATVRRLIPCVISRRPLPRDLMKRAVERASSPQGYKSKYLWEQALGLACSFVKKYNNLEVNYMALDTECRDRSYLYGRLLAVLDNAEESTYSETDSKRQTNAMKYMTVYSQRPFEVFQLIREKLVPYLAKSKYGKVYEKKLSEICDKFEVGQFADNTRLDGKYLLGFYQQRNENFKKGNNKEEESND